MRRCRWPGGASHALAADAASGDGAATLPGRAGVRSLEAFTATEAAHEAPAMRKIRKLDSLSAATKGPTTGILRFMLRCVNQDANPDLESRVQAAGTMRASMAEAESERFRPRLGSVESRREIDGSAPGGAMPASQNRWQAPDDDQAGFHRSGLRIPCRYERALCTACCG
jgi:hypothetical protein